MDDFDAPEPEPKNWLEIEIKAAIKEMKRWPKWMRDAARFEPFGRPDATDRTPSTAPEGEE